MNTFYGMLKRPVCSAWPSVSEPVLEKSPAGLACRGNGRETGGSKGLGKTEFLISDLYYKLRVTSPC